MDTRSVVEVFTNKSKEFMLEHGGGFRTMYAHLSKIRVNVGDTVAKGAAVGEVGSTGRSTGAHLHLELRQNSVPIDPRPFLP